MVKRKKPASCIVDDEKRENEGSLQKNNLDGESMEISNDAQTSVPVPVNPSKSRVHVTRTCTKEVQNIISDCVETENNVSPSEKCQKTVPVSKNQRSSNRATKRIRKELNPGEPSIKKTVVTLKQNAPLRSKTRRPWELWSVEDKNAFFEALCEYGKDFESIQSFIAQRSKKKGTPANMIKNKDQVRHFYYRTWHKISKVLEIGDDVRKQTQELYGLINYAELRRKIGACLDEKNSQKLNELVFNGVTTVKYKGKKLRIKTPVCRVLKKLNQVPENEPEVEKLPKEVVLEFKPLSNKDWLYVQNLAQNPRVRTKVTLQHRLKTVIEYLQKRWKPYRLKKKEQILSSLTHFDSSIFHEDHTPLLRLKPQNLSAVSTITISALDSASSSDVCLEKHLKISRDCSADAVKTKKNNKLKSKAQSDIIADIRGRDEQISAAKSADGLNTEVLIKDYDKICLDDNYNSVLTPPTSTPDDECRDDPVDEVQRSLSLLTSMLNSVDKSCIPQKLSPEKTDLQYFKKPFIQGSAKFNSFEEMYLKNCQEGEQLTLGQLLGQSKSKSPVSSRCDDEKNESDVEKDSSSFNFHALENEEEKSENYGENDASSSNFHTAKKDDSPLLDVMKKGWTVDTVGLLTVGELYLMLGRPEKISLTYEFEEQKVDENCKETSSEIIKKKEETDVLRKLLQQAALSFTDYRNKQATPSASVKSSSNTRVNASHSAAKTSSRCVSKNSTVKSAMKSKSSVPSKLPSSVRNSNHTRVNTSFPPIKASSCYGSNISTTKTDILSKSSDSSKLNQDSVTSSIAVSSQVTNQKTVTEAAQCSTSNSVRTVCSDLMSSTPSDKHVFVVPVGTAPRTVKKPTQESLKEEISKLLPGNRRGCRVRRKPLVVQRPLLPRDRIGAVSGPRSMTLVHFVPSGSQLTAVIPSNATGAESKANMLPAKKVVKILSTGTAIDMRPIQVPLMKQMNTDASTGVILQPSAIPTAHLMVTSPVVQNISHQTLSSVINNSSSNLDSLVNLSETTKLISSAASTQSTVSGINSLAISLPSHTIQPLTSTSECSSRICDSLISSSPPQISIPDTQCSSSDLSSGHVPSFLEISLPDSLSAKNPESSNSSLLDFSDSSSLCAFGISSSSSSSAKLESEDLSSTLPSCLSSDPSVTSTESSTPSRNLPNRLFRISSPGPEAQWLNGEGVEFSFSSLLNTLESPSKVLSLSSSASNVGNENSNLDPIARLAPVMDSQVRCLLEECSVDFITKFEDLADEINSPSMDSKQT